MNIGIDFGSTYSTVAKYDSFKGCAEAMTLSEGASASIPSVVSISKKGVITSGAAAKEQVGKKTVRIYEAFKMLINETNNDMLRHRGYDSENTPQLITSYFLESVLQGAMKREGSERIDNVVICAPEIWWNDVHTLDGRQVLRTVLKDEIDLPVKDVRVVTEPEAASAFIAYNYEKATKNSFNGHLLLIDYGGGTLDLTLTQVTSDGKGSMEISYRESGGAGENHPDANGNTTIGKAGIAYMQDVVTRALQDAGMLAPDEIVDYTGADFVAAVKDLESQMKSADRIKDIEEVFGEYGKYSKFEKILDEDPIDFISLEYAEEEVPVTYQHLFSSYREIIEQVLETELNRIAQLTKGHLGIDPRTPAVGARDDFKIAMVGGFCTFYLVRQQIAEIYTLDTNNAIDMRVKNVSVDKQEQAIALGAALLAEGKVVLKKTARFSIGIHSQGYDGSDRLAYGIKYHQTVEPGKPYFLCFTDEEGDVPSNRITYGGIRNNITSFAIEYSASRNRGGLLKLKSEMIQKLQKIPDEGFWNLGFSMDESEAISFHMVPKMLGEASGISTPDPIVLGRFSNLFELTEVKEVTIS